MKSELVKTADALMDDISADPVNWRMWEDRLRQVIAGHADNNMDLPAQLRVYADWLRQDDLEDQFENMPV
ncbi:hypothetical protein [Maritimibacter sp. UBA3975]|uniref:hypothetical protein n=1 Tax=Maritimibacter sp. UBA3975 TaxID=1946833 RepID=UPI000C0B6BDC|nr:hypothetical protein [Maritimibacter sp. UBA3975]MAM61520.1 hypothetical protein [Maritimibacter sp.]|tara:strand:- start:7101 stop:7310 length:210 start_codon:yes stop_codon:yes gene_type:complete